MTHPKAVFLDTCVFAGQQYNFNSAVIRSFVPAAKAAEIKLLLPDPTAREIARQIKERSDDALKALDNARRKAPFLSKWKHFPKHENNSSKWEVGRVAHREWNDFLQQFHVEKLDYQGVSIAKIMTWYDSVRAPFGSGEKRKEFPDAFAIEILALYAAKNDLCIAVVSEDKDMRSACEHYSSLLHFNSLAQLTESLLSGNAKLELYRAIVESNIELIETEISDEIELLSTYIFEDGYEESERSFGNPTICHTSIVGIGVNECTIIFKIEFVSEHKIQWSEIDAHDGFLLPCSQWISQSNSMTGQAKIIFSFDNSPKVSRCMIELDANEIDIIKVPQRY